MMMSWCEYIFHNTALLWGEYDFPNTGEMSLYNISKSNLWIENIATVKHSLETIGMKYRRTIQAN